MSHESSSGLSLRVSISEARSKYSGFWKMPSMKSPVPTIFGYFLRSSMNLFSASASIEPWSVFLSPKLLSVPLMKLYPQKPSVFSHLLPSMSRMSSLSLSTALTIGSRRDHACMTQTA